MENLSYYYPILQVKEIRLREITDLSKGQLTENLWVHIFPEISNNVKIMLLYMQPSLLTILEKISTPFIYVPILELPSKWLFFDLRPKTPEATTSVHKFYRYAKNVVNGVIEQYLNRKSDL